VILAPVPQSAGPLPVRARAGSLRPIVTLYDRGMARPCTNSEMSESEMAALLLKAQEEERLGQVTRCDDPGELREFLADIRAHRV
jgi:hypothetical protein